jgi:hypothetical protein
MQADSPQVAALPPASAASRIRHADIPIELRAAGHELDRQAPIPQKARKKRAGILPALLVWSR